MSSTHSKYFLKKLTNTQCKADISSRSDEFKSIQSPTIIDKKTKEEKTIDKDEYIASLIEEIDNADRVFYGSIQAPDDEEIIKMVIGKSGCYFYLTTDINNILFIWHNRVTKQFEFWGQFPGRVISAMRAIDNRISKSLENKVKSLNKKLEKLNIDNSIIHENIKYNKIKVGNTHYFVKETTDKNPQVYSIVADNLLGKYIGEYIEYDKFTKGPTIRLSYNSILDDNQDVTQNKNNDEKKE